jgi:hypothetical protein
MTAAIGHHWTQKHRCDSSKLMAMSTLKKCCLLSRFHECSYVHSICEGIRMEVKVTPKWVAVARCNQRVDIAYCIHRNERIEHESTLMLLATYSDSLRNAPLHIHTKKRKDGVCNLRTTRCHATHLAHSDMKLRGKKTSAHHFRV